MGLARVILRDLVQAGALQWGRASFKDQSLPEAQPAVRQGTSYTELPSQEPDEPGASLVRTSQFCPILCLAEAF